MTSLAESVKYFGEPGPTPTTNSFFGNYDNGNNKTFFKTLSSLDGNGCVENKQSHGNVYLKTFILTNIHLPILNIFLTLGTNSCVAADDVYFESFDYRQS